MDTITQMQEKQFEANELQAKLRREIVEEQSRTAAAGLVGHFFAFEL